MYLLAQVDVGTAKSAAESAKDFIGDSVILIAVVVALVGSVVLMWAWSKFIAPSRKDIAKSEAERAMAESTTATAVKDTAQMLPVLVRELTSLSAQMTKNIDRMDKALSNNAD